MKILLTNDDSHRSPLLEFVIEKLAPLGTLYIVVPKHEQSWKSKAMTRFGALHLEKMKLWGHPAYTVDGTPADCINLAIHHVTRGKPDLVVSGINAGLNTGTSFLFSSGTVGACFEANIGGVPAIALSQCFDSYTRNRYLVDYKLSASTSKRLRAQSSPWIDRILAVWGGTAKFRKAPITWNVNFPFKAERRGGDFRLCPLGRSRYGSCFKKRSGHFEHDLEDVLDDSRPESDIHTVLSGHVSVTPLDISGFGQLSDKSLASFGKRFVKSLT